MRYFIVYYFYVESATYDRGEKHQMTYGGSLKLEIDHYPQYSELQEFISKSLDLKDYYNECVSREFTIVPTGVTEVSKEDYDGIE